MAGQPHAHPPPPPPAPPSSTPRPAALARGAAAPPPSPAARPLRRRGSNAGGLDIIELIIYFTSLLMPRASLATAGLRPGSGGIAYIEVIHTEMNDNNIVFRLGSRTELTAGPRNPREKRHSRDNLGDGRRTSPFRLASRKSAASPDFPDLRSHESFYNVAERRNKRYRSS